MSSFATYHIAVQHLVVSNISTRIINCGPWHVLGPSTENTTFNASSKDSRNSGLTSGLCLHIGYQGKCSRKIHQHKMRLPPIFLKLPSPSLNFNKKNIPVPPTQLLHRREPTHSEFVSFNATVRESVVLSVFQHHKSPSSKMSCGSFGAFRKLADINGRCFEKRTGRAMRCKYDMI